MLCPKYGILQGGCMQYAAGDFMQQVAVCSNAAGGCMQHPAGDACSMLQGRCMQHPAAPESAQDAIFSNYFEYVSIQHCWSADLKKKYVLAELLQLFLLNSDALKLSVITAVVTGPNGLSRR